MTLVLEPKTGTFHVGAALSDRLQDLRVKYGRLLFAALSRDLKPAEVGDLLELCVRLRITDNEAQSDLGRLEARIQKIRELRKRRAGNELPELERQHEAARQALADHLKKSPVSGARPSAADPKMRPGDLERWNRATNEWSALEQRLRDEVRRIGQRIFRTKRIEPELERLETQPHVGNIDLSKKPLRELFERFVRQEG